MAITIPAPQHRELTEYKSAPDGSHSAVCIKVVLLGTLYDEKWEKMKLNIYLQWELPDELMEDGKPYVIGKTFTASFHEKGKFRPMLESWRGKKFEESEMAELDVANLLGKTCLLQVVGGFVQGVMALPKGMTVAKPTNDLVAFNVNEWNDIAFQKLSKHHQEKIKSSKEYKQYRENDNEKFTKEMSEEEIDF